MTVKMGCSGRFNRLYSTFIIQVGASNELFCIRFKSEFGTDE